MLRIRGLYEVYVFRENPSNEGRDVCRKAYSSPNKVLLLSNRWLRYLHSLYWIRGYFEVWIFRKIPPTEAEIQRSHIAFQIKYPLLLAIRNQTWNCHSACVYIARYEFSGESLQWKPRNSWEGTLPWRKVPLIIDRSQPTLQYLWDMHGECEEWMYENIHPMEAVIRPIMHVALQVICH